MSMEIANYQIVTGDAGHGDFIGVEATNKKSGVPGKLGVIVFPRKTAGKGIDFNNMVIGPSNIKITGSIKSNTQSNLIQAFTKNKSYADFNSVARVLCSNLVKAYTNEGYQNVTADIDYIQGTGNIIVTADSASPGFSQTKGNYAGTSAKKSGRAKSGNGPKVISKRKSFGKVWLQGRT